MRTAAFFAVAAALLPSVFAQGRVTVAGVSDGKIGVRREITDLSRDQDAWNLYILAMNRFVNSDTNSALSYHQISAIHGLPCQPYSGVEGNQAAINQGGCGYCTHSTTLFPVWHRPYVALYEQAFYEQVKGVISDFSGNADQQAKFQAAASGLRIPYWDWAMGSGGVPSFFSQQTISVPSTRGGSRTIANPLYNYKYQVFNQQVTGGAPFSGWQQTLRWPTSDAPNAQNDFGALTNQINSQFRSYQANVYKVLLNCKQWTEMADDSAANSSPDCSSSLEAVHGLIHVLIGGKGHMAYLDQAGFDPLFWLHHTNVDRLLSIWQIAQDKTWYAGGSNGFATYTHTEGQFADGNFPLTPFYKDGGSQQFWTPNDLADWTKLGYTYPETSGGLGTSKSQIISDINRLYGSQAVTPPPPASSSRAVPSSTRAPVSSSHAGVPSSSRGGVPPVQSSFGGFPGNHSASVSIPGIPIPSIPSIPDIPGLPSDIPIPSLSYGGLPSALPSYFPDLPSYLPDLLTPLGRKWEWAANIVSERMGLGGSYSIYIFLGEVPSDSSTWGTAKNLIGVHSVFASKKMTTTGYLTSGSVSLTATLVEQIMAGNLRGLHAIVVQPFLKQKLSWAVAKCTGEVVPNDQVPGLQVKVVSSRVKPASKPDAAPVFEKPEELDVITEGEAGGAKPGSNPYTGSVPTKGGSGSFGTNGPLSPIDAPSGAGYESGSGSGSYGGGLTDGQPSCVPDVKYVYEYVTVSPK